MPVAVASAQEDGEDGAIFIPKIAANGRGAEDLGGEDGACRLYMSAELEETVRKSQQLIERICEVNGVTARSPTMAGAGLDVARVEAWSEEGHQGCAVLAEYLQKRAQLESTYAQGLQKLNRGALQGLKEGGAAGDPRLNALLVYGEKTAAGHASLAQRVASARVVEGLRGLVQGAEQERRGLLGAVREGRGRWKRAVLAFDKVRQGCEKSVRAEAAACSACRAASERGQQLSASHVRRVREAYERARAKALDARATFAEAREALRQEHRAVFGRALPECFRGLERLERARLGAVRAALLGVAEGQLAVAQAEAENGAAWVQSLVASSIDDDIERFVRQEALRAPAPAPAASAKDSAYDDLRRNLLTAATPDLDGIELPASPQLEDPQGDPGALSTCAPPLSPRCTLEEKLSREREREERPDAPRSDQPDHPDHPDKHGTPRLYTTPNAFAGEARGVLEARQSALALHVDKLEMQRNGLLRIHQAYQEDGAGRRARGTPDTAETVAAVERNLERIERELLAARHLRDEIALALREAELQDMEAAASASASASATASAAKAPRKPRPMAPAPGLDSFADIIDEIDRIATAHAGSAGAVLELSRAPLVRASSSIRIVREKKKCLSRSFDDLLRDDSEAEIEAGEEQRKREEGKEDRREAHGLQDSGPRCALQVRQLAASAGTLSKLPGNYSRSMDHMDECNGAEDQIIFERNIWKLGLGKDSDSGVPSRASSVFRLPGQGDAQSDERSGRNERTEHIRHIEHTEHAEHRNSTRSRSSSLSTPNPNNAAPPKTASSTTPFGTSAHPSRPYLFRVQALYSFAGCRETDELDLAVGEILCVLADDGEWWEAMNDAGAVGYIPFNYVMRLKA